jgi:hypothetical protein
MFAKNFTWCTSVHNRNIKKAHWNCDNCHAFKVSGNMYKIGQTICKHSDNILRAIALAKRSEMTDADFFDLQSFVNRNSNATWSESGLALVECFKTTIHYYETIKSLTDSKDPTEKFFWQTIFASASCSFTKINQPRQLTSKA